MKKSLIAAALLVGIAAPASAERMDKYSVYYRNEASSTIVSIMVRNEETGRSLGDILIGTIPPGQEKLVSFQDGTNSCLFRSKTILANDAETPWVQRDICRHRRITVND